MIGVYVLLIWVKIKTTIRIGKLGPLMFGRGLYFYVGRALKGLEARIEKHLRRNKKHFWHIDYLPCLSRTRR
jgi:Uri superfamily endonuclease